MTLKSMTGFARASGQAHGYRWTWEIKSVNGRGLDVRCRVPSIIDGLDIRARQQIGKRLGRGNVSANLDMRREAEQSEIAINEGRLEQLLAVVQRFGDREGITPARLDGLLAVKGVIEVADTVLDDDQRAGLETALLEGLDTTLGRLVEARAGEGDRLAPVLTGLLDDIAGLIDQAAGSAGTQPDAIRDRLANQIGDLLEGGTVPDERLAQEVAVLAAKADVREELDRLGAHLTDARALMGGDGPVGRRLDFLAQEFNRETNTLCAKSSDKELTRLGLELKTVIDRFREQVQNIE